MKPRSVATVLLTLSLGTLSPVAASAQHEGHAGKSAPARSASQVKRDMTSDHRMMSSEPHHVLAMAYHQNLATFTTALQEHAVRTGPIQAEFARDAAAEMRRSFDKMKDHHQEHVKSMTPEMHARMGEMMKQMETHKGELDGQIAALEQEVRLSTPDPGKVAKLAAGVNTHLAAMAKMKANGKGTKMTMKM